MTDLVRREVAPAAVGTGETIPAYQIAAGERVLWASTRLVVPAGAASTATLEVGDGSDVDGYVTTTDLVTTATVRTIAAGSGAYLATSGGKLYTAADTVDVTYTPGGDPKTVAPRIALALGVARDWPTG